jgi:putative tricarboxylic transport membrane protein
MTTDRLSGIALVLFAIVVMVESRTLPLGSFRQPGPAYIPVLLGLLLFLFGALLAFTSGRAPAFSAVTWNEWPHAAAVLAASLFSAFAIERLGYRLTILLVIGFLLTAAERRGWMTSLLVALSLSFGSFYLFNNVLRVPLPEGPLGF